MAIESVGGSVVSKIAELLVEPAIRQFRYMFCFNNFVQEFNEQKKNLVLTLDRLQKAVEVAERNAEEIYEDVIQWLEDANNGIEGAKALENEIEKNGKCFTWCPNCMRQFKLSMALAKKSETFRKLQETRKTLTAVSCKAPPRPIEFLPTGEFMPSKSSGEAFEQIMKALKDDNVNMIGLCGMGGVGKTTLVKEVGRIAKDSKLFDEVLMAPVSQTPNVVEIQNRMADMLGLKIEGNSKGGRADRLREILEKVDKLLVILDDVWEVIYLEEIGIPFGDDHRGCKILLTTRLEEKCFHMKCQEKVFLRVLSEEEAWALFKINAGLRDEDSDLNRVANEVARECQGLPIALVAVGKALEGKSIREWEVASEDLKKSQSRHVGKYDDRRNAYACLKLSYDYLKDEETKFCFLLCSLFPEDYDIPIEELTRYAVGYGIYQDVESIEGIRKRVYMEIEYLKACCMLLGTETEEDVKMHDLFRDVAIQIAYSSEKYRFMVKAGFGLKEWPMSNKSFEGCKVVSLMGNKLAELPEGLVCPQLKVLLLELDRGLNVPERFFEGMKAIEVLSLKGGCLSLQSLQFSTNLQSLLLRRCDCKDLNWLRKLQRLEILGFMWCSSVEELPDEIGTLKELRLLDLTACQNLRRIPVNLIGRLKKLEELLIGSFKGWDVVGCDSAEGMNASLTELNSLSHLAVLSLKMPKVECIPRDFVFPRLLKYDILLGNGYSKGVYPTSTRLYLGGISATSLNAKTFEQLFPTVSRIYFWRVEGLRNIVLSSDQMTSHGHGSQKDFLLRLEHVKVKECGDIHTLFPAKWRQALNNLRSVEIDKCNSLEEVFELGEADEGSSEEKELPLLSSLTTLRLCYLPELKCIWKGPTRLVSLQSLIHLELSSLDKLTFIFTPSLAQSLIHLETLQIKECGGLKRLIREKDDEGEIIPESLGFPKLKTLCIVSCHYLEYVFPVSVSPSFQNLEEMEIREANNLKQVFYSGEGDDIIVKSKIKDGIIDFPQLRKLSLLKCSFFGRKDFAAQLPSLQCLTIHYHEEWDDLLAQLRGLTSLETLSLSCVLPDLRCICKGLMLSYLTSLTVYSCERLTRVFTHSMIASLLQLQVLEISNCEELEQIIARDNNDEKHQILSESDLQSACFPNLCRLQIRGCNKLKSLFSIAMASGLKKLQILEVRESSQLLGVFGQGSPVNVEKEMVLPDLQVLLLIQLPSIFCFSLGCSNFLFPNLKKLEVDGCPKLTIESATTSNDSMSAQSKAFMNLKEISIGNLEGVQDLMQVGSLVTNISGRHELSLLSLETLHLNLLPDMRCIWKGLVPCNLTTLKVNKCKRLTHVFTDNMIASLVQLRVLEISNCDELEQIIALDNDDEKDQILSRSDLQSTCFPNLYRLDIRGCNKLKSLFPVAMASGLKKLCMLEVRESSQLLGVFGQDDHASRANTEKELVLPNLEWLFLEKLPSIVYFSHGCYDFIFPHLFVVEVRQCPKLTTTFATTSNGSMSAQSEVSQVAEDASTCCSVPTNTCRTWTRISGWEEEKEDGVR